MERKCIIIGASHAGVNCAFALRRNGWEGPILIYDKDPHLPYHRPPLSKTYLSNADGIEKNILKSAESYEKKNLTLHLGTFVKSINRTEKIITLEDDSIQSFDKLIFATGARAFLPPIKNIEKHNKVFTMRTAADANKIRETFNESENKKVVVIGGGYIGLEVAASLRKLGGEITVLEREDRILKRVAPALMSEAFNRLHNKNGVDILCNKNVEAIENDSNQSLVVCEDGNKYPADLIVVGVGIRVNTELAAAGGLTIENGIKVNAACQTSDENIYAIGDCSYHHNPHFDCHLRLESVQNAVDQAKVAAAHICGKDVIYDTIPWFWSDQYDVKLQMVGISNGYNHFVKREEEGDKFCFSVWYFKDEQLLAVDAVNNARAYMLGTKLIKKRQKINTVKLSDPKVPLKPTNILTE